MPNTTPIFVSNQFQSILNKIYTESWIAEKLLSGNIESELLVDNPINYIRISGSDHTKISYLPYKKVEQTVRIITDKHKGRGSELLKLGEIPSEWMYKAKGRVKIKYGSFVNKLFKNVPPKDVEKFASLLKSITDQPPFEMEVVSGKEVRKFYHVEYHARQSGSLGVSCMRHDNCQRWFEMYVHNPDEIKMLIMFDRERRVMARALLWNLGKKNGLEEEFKFMDRIYSTKDDQIHHFFEWAKENGYYYKEKQSWNTPYRFKSKDGNFEKKMKIKLTISPANFAKSNGGYGLPYLDTFKWMNIKDGTLYNYKPDEDPNKRDIYTPVATNGDYYGFNYMKEDEYHKEYWYEGEIKTVPYLDKLVSERYLTWSKINDCYILNQHATIENYIGDYIFNEEYEKFNNREEINRIIEIKKEKERIRLEKIKIDVMKSLDFFSKYVEVCDPFLKGERKTIARPSYMKEREKSIDGKKSGNNFIKKVLSDRYNLPGSNIYDLFLDPNEPSEPDQNEPTNDQTSIREFNELVQRYSTLSTDDFNQILNEESQIIADSHNGTMNERDYENYITRLRERLTNNL